MKIESKIKMTEQAYKLLREHLFPGDGKEAAAIALCGRGNYDGSTQFLLQELVLIPYKECSIRESNLVKWSTDRLIPLIEKAEKYNLSILKIHCHPTWYDKFSRTDDASDKELFSSVYGWVNDEGPHSSLVMLPDGSMFARLIMPDLSFRTVNKINVIGDDIKIYTNYEQNQISSPSSLRTAQAFGDKTTSLLGQLRIGVVGCSGTGSLVIEQLHRLKVGELILVDPDRIEEVNLNRIPYSTLDNAKQGVHKVQMFKEVIESSGLGSFVSAIPYNLYDSKSAVKQLAMCDIVFGCMDSVDGRHLLNRLATFYLLPYFDLGVKLISDRKGGIEKILSALHYIQPGKSSLLTRNVYSPEELRIASMKRTNPDFYSEQKRLKYIADVIVPSPAVISINMQSASLAVSDFLARIHPFRYSSNKYFAHTVFDVTDWSLHHGTEGEIDKLLCKYVGRGDMPDLLDMQF